MREPLRLSPFPSGSPGRSPPLAPATPDAAELAAHVARQAGAGPEPIRQAGPPPPDPESPVETSRRRRAEETRPTAAPRHESTGGAGPGARDAEAIEAELSSRSARAIVREGRVVHPVAPFGRPDPEQRAAALRLVDGIGLHLVCPEPRCRRAKRCRDPDPAQLPLCLWLHRGTCRFVLACLADRAEDGEPADGRDARPEGWASRSGVSVLEHLGRAGWPIERLARAREDGADEWSWEAHPETRALVDAFRRPTGTEP